ncbi:extracellular solute-binding protein [Staphylococcus lugdunensis]|jgi:putative aldouronate transport system substrate-binding protein|uniref:Extracellular solute-binding protein n=1 Tax=Staphylococcus lugdunensis TaxID=28035 RepID=A0A4Q9WB49_STALU|nr:MULTISPECIES: extracellular solute-binding protein [Staphylococcus]AMG61744.1 ABC transporter [Staphylococcus lugdunensis]AMG64322.1 ABC transporter [Staphylococcus lugdunensis]ARB78827.2 ABC transporter [Staphylococcus lugdunensis]ARJ10257.1 ABC transporter [Staphylococcus lugdunensis]ARJ17637.1 ABC transporter [Staphylococcus lugdunensis]
MKHIKKLSILLLVLLLVFVTACGKDEDEEKRRADAKGKPKTWIADRKLKGLVFQSKNDVSPEMNKEIEKELKKKTGITLELQTASGNDSTEALTSGLASGDLPDFIVYYLDNSGRPEMKVLNKAAKQGQLTDLKPLLKDTNVYKKYLKKDYLPKDTRDNIMFPKDLDGTYFVHMGINRKPGDPGRKVVGGPYIRKDIAEQLNLDPSSIKTSKDMKALAEKIKNHHFKDDNGKEITPIGPTAWGGSDRTAFYNDLVWTGGADEKFQIDHDKVKHESDTDYGMKRVKYVKSLMDEGLMHKAFYTMSENQAKEGLVNGSWGIVSDLHNYVTENQSMKYIPLGPLNTVKGKYQMEMSYKSGYGGWSIPKSTKHPEDVVKLADFLASREGKLLGEYGIKGRDYNLDKKGNPVVKKEVLKEIDEHPDQAKKRGFRGAGSYWADHLGLTDVDNLDDFGEREYGDNARKKQGKTNPEKMAESWHYDEKLKHAKVIDGLTVKSFLPKFDKGEELEIALDEYDESLKRAYYAKTDKESERILADAKKKLDQAGLPEFEKMIEKKIKNGEKIRF